MRQAITDAYNNHDADIITFDAANNGTPIVLSGAAGEDANANGELDILDGGDLTIQGNGATNTIIDGGGVDRVFHVCLGGGCANTVTLSDVTIRNGSVTGSGGGILNYGTLNVLSSTIGGLPSNGNTAEWGGGIYNWDEGTLNITNSTIGGVGAGNTAPIGGGINNSLGTTTVDGSTVSANTANNGGGIYNEATLNVQNNSSISANTAVWGGGGITNNGIGTTTLTGSRILNNVAIYGGGVFNIRDDAGATNVTGSCIVGNSATAFFNNQAAQQIATGNWWGAATGPNTPGADTVDGNVDTSGYLTEPILGCGFYLYLPLIMR